MVKSLQQFVICWYPVGRPETSEKKENGPLENKLVTVELSLGDMDENAAGT